MEIGDKLPELVKEVTQESINLYADATGDFNPIHVDDEFAKTTPFKGTIAHGFFIFAYLSELMTKQFGKKWISGGATDVRFKKPVRPGDTITLRATLSDKKVKNNCSMLVFDVVWENQMHEPVIVGKASVPE